MLKGSILILVILCTLSCTANSNVDNCENEPNGHLCRQRRGMFDSFESAKNWFNEKVAMPFRDSVYKPVRDWVQAKWIEHQPTLEEQFQKVLDKVDDLFGDGTVDRINEKTKDSYEQLKTINSDLSEYWRNFTMDSFRNNVTFHLQKLEDILFRTPPNRPTPQAKSMTGSASNSNNQKHQQNKWSQSSSATEEDRQHLAQELHENLVCLRSLAYNQKLFGENEKCDKYKPNNI